MDSKEAVHLSRNNRVVPESLGQIETLDYTRRVIMEEISEMLRDYLISILEGAEPEPSEEDLALALELEDQLLERQ